MRDDDEILDAYEPEFERSGDDVLGFVRRRTNGGFWLVAGTLALACIVVVVAIFANRPIADDIGHAQHSLRVAQAGAERLYGDAGSYEGAGAAGMAAQRLDAGGGLTYMDPQTASGGLDEVSVAASSIMWAAAVQIRPGACFYLKLVAGQSDPLYGVGTECTGSQALRSDEARW